MTSLYNEEKIVAYSSKQEPLTVKEYRENIERSIREYLSGNVISQENMEKKVKK